MVRPALHEHPRDMGLWTTLGIHRVSRVYTCGGGGGEATWWRGGEGWLSLRVQHMVGTGHAICRISGIVHYVCTYLVIPLLDQHQFSWTLKPLPFGVCSVVHGPDHHGIPNGAYVCAVIFFVLTHPLIHYSAIQQYYSKWLFAGRDREL